MALSYQDKETLANILALVFDDREYLHRVHQINDKTLRITEEMLSNLFFCNRATAALFGAIRCVPKSPNVYGWLLGCLPGVSDVVKANSEKIRANLLCLTHIRVKYASAIKLTLL